ncbi:MAG: hypothetical protein NUV50_01455 [Rhodospirillales bacterium]|nr:hypothetical protein [Rhodospirillales bacterium]
MNNILDKLPFGPVILLGVIFALMPILPEPHLWEKAMMIKDGVSLAPIDWFDIVLHGSSAVLVIAKVWRDRQVRAESAAASVARSSDSPDVGDKD